MLVNMTVWEEVIASALDAVFTNFADMCGDADENTEIQGRIRGVAFAELVAFARMMSELELKAEEVSRLLAKFSSRYGLPSAHVEYITGRTCSSSPSTSISP